MKAPNSGIQSKGRRGQAVTFCTFLVSFFLLSCKEGSGLPDLKGRYQGQATLRGETTAQVISQIPDFVISENVSLLQFSVFNTLASSHHAIDFTIAILPNKHIQMKIPAIVGQDLELLQTSNSPTCAASTTSNPQASLCWGNGQLKIEIQTTSQGSSYSLTLQRDDSLPPLPGKERASPYSLDELLGRAKYLNYTVSQEAEKVYQAKDSVEVARGGLLPSLNMKSIVGIITKDYIGTIGRILPFLFPNNWYRWQAQGALFEAEKSSFAALRGNEMNAVEGLYYSIYRDQAVLRDLVEQINRMREMQLTLLQEEDAGILPRGTAEYYGTSIIHVEHDRVTLEKLVKNEYTELAQAVALPPAAGVSELAQVELPDLTQVKPIQALDYLEVARKKSYELKTLKALTNAAKTATKEALFNFIDPEDETGPGLGFGTAASIRVAKSREAELRIKTTETSALIELRCAQVANEYNAALQNYTMVQSGYAAAERRLEWLMNRHRSGDNTLNEGDFIEQLEQIQMRILDLKADQWTFALSWLLARAKLDRLLLEGNYADLEAALPKERSTLRSN